MTTVLDIVRAVKPDATEDFANHILWGRTPYPCGKVTARLIYKAASGFTRALANNLRLCDLCDEPASNDSFTCLRCDSALSRARRTEGLQ